MADLHGSRLAGTGNANDLAAASDVAATNGQVEKPKDQSVDNEAAEDPAEEAAEDTAEEDPADAVFPVTIVLPQGPEKVHVMISPQEQVHELRQSIVELPAAFQYSCFHLEHDGERINDFLQISDVKGLGPQSEIHLVEDPYTEKEARIHLIRVRDLIGAAGERTDTMHGILPGVSLYDAITAEAAETDKIQASSYDFTAPANPQATLLPREEEPAPKTIKSISVSPWNPPPYHFRQKGHLLYIQVTTNEGEQYQITCHVSGFYVNKSSHGKFDPSPKAAPKGHSAHSLFTLIEQISPSFSGSFDKLLQHAGRKDAMATFPLTNAIPAAPWLVPAANSPLRQHTADITRTQEGYLIAGVDNTDSLRDWNEEFQSARELPKETVQDRVFRERFISKLFADYTDAAARGAMLVARGEVTPLNPTEGCDAQIYVYNNVFFSFGADGVGTFTGEGGDDAARVATGKDVHGVRLVNQFDIDGLFTPATIVVDYLGRRIVGQTIVPGIFKQREPNEPSIDYGAVEGKDTVALDERFLETFEKLSNALRVKKHPVWDKEGKRFDLVSSVETKGLMGTDGRKYVLDLYRITPLDILWIEDVADDKDTAAAYPHRMTVLRPELVEAVRTQKWTEWVNAELVKRQKQLAAKSASKNKGAVEEGGATASEDQPAAESGETDPQFEEAQVTNAETDPQPEEAQVTNAATEKKTEEDEAEAGQGKGEKESDDGAFNFALNPDAFSGQIPQTEEEKQELAADEKDVRAACTYLRETVIPEFVTDIKTSELPFPIDGQSLSRMMHKRGINIRYLSKVLAQCEGPRLAHLGELCKQEMITRAFKHIAGKYLRHLPVPLTSACIAHLLNCLLGTAFNPKPRADANPSLKGLYRDVDLAYCQVSPESLRLEIEQQTLSRFRYGLAPDWHAKLKHLQVLRQISLKLGLQLQARDFHFTEPASNGVNGAKDHSNGEGSKKKKKKASRDGSPGSAAPPPNESVTFVADDIMNVVPVVKDSAPKSLISEEALEGGRQSIMQGNRKIGMELLLESLTLHEQIYGILHADVARAYATLAQIYSQLEEKEAAVDLARKACIVAERTLGLDSAETLLYYLSLSLFTHASGDSKTALAYIKRALDLWKVVYGADYPDSITTLNNAAVMLQNMQAFHESRIWFEQALEVCDRIMGKESLSSASILFQLAQALALDGEAKAALARMRESYNIFREHLGPDNNNTKEAEVWLEQLTQNAVAVAKRDKDVEARRLRAGINFPSRGTALGSSGTAQGAVLQNRKASKPPAIDSRSIDDLIQFIEGSEAQKKSTKKQAGRGAAKTRLGAPK